MNIKNIVIQIIKLILLLLITYGSFKLTGDLYIVGLIGFTLILFFFFKYQEIFIISFALVIATLIIYLFNSQLYYEKVGEFLFTSLIAGLFRLIFTLREKDKTIEEG